MGNTTINITVPTGYVSLEAYAYMVKIPLSTCRAMVRDGRIIIRPKKCAKDRIVKFPELSFDFTFHDLKAKGISDLNGSLAEKQAISGHKNIGQTAKYDRKTQIVPVVGGQ